MNFFIKIAKTYFIPEEYNIVVSVIDKVTGYIDNISVKASFVLFFVGSIGDIVTTHIGHQSGYGERSPFVEIFIEKMGSLVGVSASKMFSFFIIILASLIIAYVYTEIKETENDFKEILNVTVRDLTLIGGLIYVGATFNNLIVLFLF